MDWKSMIQPELLAITPFLYGAGMLIKNTPKIKDWLIPYILWGISLVVTIVYFALQYKSAFDGATFVAALGQATILAFATVGGNEYIKQITQGRKEDNEKYLLQEQWQDESQYESMEDEYYDNLQEPNDSNNSNNDNFQ